MGWPVVVFHFFVNRFLYNTYHPVPSLGFHCLAAGSYLERLKGHDTDMNGNDLQPPRGRIQPDPAGLQRLLGNR